MNSGKSNAVGAASVEDDDHCRYVRDNMPVMDDNAIISGDVENQQVNEGHYFAKAFERRPRGPYYDDWKRRLEDMRTRDATYEEMLSRITESQKRYLFRDHFRRKRQRKQDAAIIGSIMEFDPATVESQRREMLQDHFRRVPKTNQDVDKGNEGSNDNFVVT